MRIILCAFLLALAACTTTPRVKDPGRTTQVEGKDGTTQTVTESDAAVFNKLVQEVLSRPLVKLTCPATGCVMLSFEVAQPLQGSPKDLLYAPKDPTPEVHPAAQVVSAILGPVERVSLALGGPGIIMAGMKNIFSSFAGTAISMAGKIQAPAGTSVAITGSNGVGVLGGSGTASTTDRHDSTISTVTTTTDASNRLAIDIICNFAVTTGSPPSYCSAPR